MGLAPATQPLRASGLKSTDFSVIPDQDSENALPDPVSIKAFYSSSEPLVVSEWYSATQFIVRETVLQSGSEFMISPPDFSAHGLQATDATLPNYVSVDIDGEAQEEANSIYRIARSTDSGALIVTLLRDLAIESPFEVTYQNVVRSPADLAPLTLPLAYRSSEGSIWHPITVEAKTVLPGEPTRLAISAPSKASRSEPFNIAIVAMDQFGHPADRQPRSLDLRSEGKLIGRVSPDAETGLLSSEQTVNELTVTRFEARSPGGGLRGASNWIDVQRTPDRQLLWTDFSPEAMRALPSVPFSAVEPFTGDDQLGAALTRQIVPMIDIPEPSTEALSEGRGSRSRKRIQCRRNRRFWRESCRGRIRRLHGQHRKVEQFGFGRTRDRRKFRGRSRAFCAGGSTIWTVIGARKGQQRFNRWFISCFRAGGRDTRDRDRC